MSYKKTSATTYEHRQVVEGALGRELKSHEIVHHVDNDPKNNSHNNLVLCPNQKYHMLLHSRQRVVDLGGNPNTEKYCSYHKLIESKDEFSPNPSMPDSLHNSCRKGTNEYRRLKGLNVNKFDWKARLNQQYRRVKSLYTMRNISWL